MLLKFAIIFVFHFFLFIYCSLAWDSIYQRRALQRWHLQIYIISSGRVSTSERSQHEQAFPLTSVVLLPEESTHVESTY